MYLTKSDFTSTRDCPTKLFFKKQHYPSLAEDSPYLEFLADGGYMVEKMARLLYPEGRIIGNWDKPDEAFIETRMALEAGNCTLFEATVIHGKFLVRVDILQRFGRVLRLIEVKSSSVETAVEVDNPFRGKRGGISSDWLPYLEDVTFQTIALKRAFPKYTVVPYLCVADKSKTATENCTCDKFRLLRGPGADNHHRAAVEYTGNAAGLAKEHILAILNISGEVSELEDAVAASADTLAATITGDEIQKFPAAIGKKCKKCEYRTKTPAGQVSGFRECWGSGADSDPHLLDLYRIDLVGGKSSDYVTNMAANHRTRLADVREADLSGSTAERQRLQLDCTAHDKEHIDPELTRLLKAHRHPLHFIDFEASRLALPYHVGMHPYELATFQWSCHTIRTAAAPVEHHEWLNDRDAFPNFAFARTLRDTIGSDGTVYVWSPYERSALRAIKDQLECSSEHDDDLVSWLAMMSDEQNPRIVDLCKLARDYYFHPIMKGSLSIKYVLPAVWTQSATLREDPLFAEYVRYDGKGCPINPYDTLPSLPIGAKEEVVKEGTGAMRVYQEMMYGEAQYKAELRQSYRQLLLQYCKLDTAAMLMIWKHWAQSL